MLAGVGAQNGNKCLVILGEGGSRENKVNGRVSINNLPSVRLDTEYERYRERGRVGRSTPVHSLVAVIGIVE